ncbi:membrane lipoprotein lipid attachment site-containing protein [Dysgonomonas sp. HGC4]|uniref:membrane lipoprotein lipid attachment site-containing protein n=1 Tax=Dysgonomonas sp. HGC4 TaxID=1658009 RepID=UPI000681B39E|nr:membrane lipoprotein lipid attachment site-containing protein [Dysgonomonas sp. HGC4]MBD8349349.1 membrane lipoprotein lipid attachment site-containing protein [Dysgonomonas sp. HGC4]
MRKILFIFCAVFLLSGCSKDDENDSLAKIGEFKGTEVKNTDEYLSTKYGIIVNTDIYFVKNGYYPASSKSCPNVKVDHSKNSIYLYPSSYPQTPESIVTRGFAWACGLCKGVFDPYTGKPLNDKAQGYTLQMYKLSIKDDVYTIWK